MYPYLYIFEDSINKESVQQAIDIIHHQEEVTLHLTTDGGDIRSITSLIEYLNTRIDNVSLILSGELSSAGSFFIMDYQGIIGYTPYFIGGTIHKGYITEHTNWKTDEEKYNKLMLLKSNSNKLTKYKELGITEEQEKDYIDGKDVFIDREQYIRWIDKHNKGIVIT